MTASSSGSSSKSLTEGLCTMGVNCTACARSAAPLAGSGIRSGSAGSSAAGASGSMGAAGASSCTRTGWITGTISTGTMSSSSAAPAVGSLWSISMAGSSSSCFCLRAKSSTRGRVLRGAS